MPPPAIAIRRIEDNPIVRVLTDTRVEQAREQDVLGAGQHPNGFEQVENRVSVAFSPEQYALVRLLVNSHDRFREGEYGTVTRLLFYSNDLEFPERFADGVIYVSCSYLHGYTLSLPMCPVDRWCLAKLPTFVIIPHSEHLSILCI